VQKHSTSPGIEPSSKLRLLSTCGAAWRMFYCSTLFHFTTRAVFSSSFSVEAWRRAVASYSAFKYYRQERIGRRIDKMESFSEGKQLEENVIFLKMCAITFLIDSDTFPLHFLENSECANASVVSTIID
jgi:hypothetical protein